MSPVRCAAALLLLAAAAVVPAERPPPDGPRTQPVSPETEAQRRRRLGWREFEGEVPEDVCFRDYPYVRTVEAAARKRWFAPGEEPAFEAAAKALVRTLEHRQRLIDDHRFRAGDAARARIAQDPEFADHVRGSHWSAPFLVCCASGERVGGLMSVLGGDEPDLGEERRRLEAARAALAARAETRARLVRQLYDEFLRRYRTPLGVEDLADEHGGAPDLPPGVRSFHDGVPLVVWIFESQDAYADWELARHRRPRRAGYLSHRSGWVITFDGEAPGLSPEWRHHRLLRLAVQQVLYWFSRQQNRWARPSLEASGLGEGFSRWFAGAALTPDGRLDFTRSNGYERADMRRIRRQLERDGRTYPLFTLVDLLAASSHAAIRARSIAWDMDPADAAALYATQCWAFVQFLNEGARPAYRERFPGLLRSLLQGSASSVNQEPPDLGTLPTWARESLRVWDTEDRDRMQAQFHAYVRERLLKDD